MEDYKKYRWFYTSSGLLVIGGKNAIQNDELLSKTKDNKENFIIMHTSEPGSPFCVIQAPISNISKQDIEETSIFTGCFSRAWRMGKSSAQVDIFNSSQIHKNKNMNAGTWGVYGDIQRVSVPLSLVFTKQKDILRAIPEKTFIRSLQPSKSKKPVKDISVVKITPGNIEKAHMFAKLELELDDTLGEEQVLSAIPAGKFKIQKEVIIIK